MNIHNLWIRAVGLVTGEPVSGRVRFGPPRPTRLHTTETYGVRLIRRGAPIFPARRTAAQWVDRGWQFNGGAYRGSYHAGTRRWQGLIREPYPGGFEAYIWRPPLQEIAAHTGHRPCFVRPQPDGRYMVHFWEMPATLDHAIKSIEDVLKEATHARR